MNTDVRAMSGGQSELGPVDPRAELAAEIAAQRDDSLGFPEWYLSEMGKCDFMELRIKEQAEKMLAEIDARRKALEWKYGQDFRAQVERDLAEKNRGKSKQARSVKYLTGTAGFRTTPPKLIVTNDKALMDWAAINVPEAVKLEPKLHLTPVKRYIESGGEQPPGCIYQGKGQRFYPTALNKEIGYDEGTGRDVTPADPHPAVVEGPQDEEQA